MSARRLRPPWKPEYDELSAYNGEKMRAAGVQYRYTATPSERWEEQKRAQAWLDQLSPDYLARMAKIQRDYNETQLGMNYTTDALTAKQEGK